MSISKLSHPLTATYESMSDLMERYTDLSFKDNYFNGCISYIKNITKTDDIVETKDVILSTNGYPSDSELKRPLGIGNEGYSVGLGIYNERAFFQIQFPYFKMKLSSYTYTCLINDLFEGTEMYGSKNGIE